MKIEKIKNIIANLNDKTKYIIHITNLKLSIRLRIKFEKSS